MDLFSHGIRQRTKEESARGPSARVLRSRSHLFIACVWVLNQALQALCHSHREQEVRLPNGSQCGDARLPRAQREGTIMDRERRDGVFKSARARARMSDQL